VLSLPDFDQRPDRFRDPMQRRDASSRPWMLFHERPAIQRAEATQTHPETVGTLTRRCAPQGLRGLCPDSVDIVPAGSRPRVSNAVVQERKRLQGLYDGFPYRELVRILYDTWQYRLGDHPVKRLWHQLPGSASPQLPRLDSHRYPERSQARFEVIQRSLQGGSKTRIRRFLPVARPPINAWMDRFARDHVASLEAKGAAPHTPARQAWLPVMRARYPLHKRHPQAGGCRMGSLRGQTDRSVRTGARSMAVNRQVDDAIPHVGRKRTQTAPQRHPCTASVAHESWCIDGRMMDLALAGVKGWSRIGLDGSSRPRLAGAVAPTEASWGALTVL